MVIEHGDGARGPLARLWRRLSGMPEPQRPDAGRALSSVPAAVPGGRLPAYPAAGGAARPVVSAEEVEGTRFEPRRFMEGYAPDEVDAFLRRVVDDLRRPPGSGTLTSADIDAVRFRATKFRAGYVQEEVDDLLDRVAAELHRRAARA